MRNRLVTDHIVLMAFALTALSGFASVSLAQEEAPTFPPAQVEVATAEMREMAPVVEVSGTVISLNDARIASEIEGVLTWMANVGDSVQAGQVIARIDPRLVKVALKRAQADVGRLEADLRFRERQLKRAEDLAASNNTAANLLDESQAQHDAAVYQLADARALLERAQDDLERTQIRAAFAGHITARLASVGEYIGVGEDIVRLVDTHQIEIALPAPIALTPYIQPDSEVRVKNGSVQRRHRVRTVVPVGDAVSRMVEIRLSVAEGDWLVGTPVLVSLPSETPRTMVAVPRDALVQRGGQSFVYRITDQGATEQITAKIQSIIGLWVGIAEGIEAGDQVIIRGAERLAPGQPVKVISSVDER